jgi:hypothetical protein
MKKKWYVVLSVLVLAVPALAYAQNSPAAQAAQPGTLADPAMQPPAAQSVPSDEPGTPPPANDPSSPAARLSDPDPTASAEAHSMRMASALPPGMSAAQACSGFKDDLECAAALHAAQNLKVPFADLKSRLTQGAKLTGAIHALKPGADAKSEARRAEDQAHADMAARVPTAG